jgi:hypothetical protein
MRIVVISALAFAFEVLVGGYGFPGGSFRAGAARQVRMIGAARLRTAPVKSATPVESRNVRWSLPGGI